MKSFVYKSSFGKKSFLLLKSSIKFRPLAYEEKVINTDCTSLFCVLFLQPYENKNRLCPL